MNISARLFPIPLYTQVVIAVACGAALGTTFGEQSYIGGLRNEHLGKVGMVVITLLKTFAIPLVFLAILDAFLSTTLRWRQGVKLLRAVHELRPCAGRGDGTQSPVGDEAPRGTPMAAGLCAERRNGARGRRVFRRSMTLLAVSEEQGKV